MRKIIVTGIAAVAVAAGIYFLLKKPAGGKSDDDEGGGGDTATVVTVHTAALSKATLHGYVDGYGVVGGAPGGGQQAPASARIAPIVSGVVVKALAAEGDVVKEGAPLIELDDRTAKAALEKAERAATSAAAAAQRQHTLFESQNSSTKAVQDADAQAAAAQSDLETARIQLSSLRLTSPIAGTVTKMAAHIGEAVDPSATLAEVTDLHRLVISADIPAEDAAKIHVGQTVDIVSQPDVHATVAAVSPAVDPATNTVTVRAALPPDGGVRPGQYVQIRIAVEEHKDVIAAPANSVVTDDDGNSVISVVTGDQAAQKKVTVGLRDGDLVEVSADGLKAGDTVVTVGAYGLPEKTKVQVVK